MERALGRVETGMQRYPPRLMSMGSDRIKKKKKKKPKKKKGKKGKKRKNANQAR